MLEIQTFESAFLSTRITLILHAGVKHGAGLPNIGVLGVGAVPVVLQVQQGLAPDAGELAVRARLDLAVHGGLVVEGVGPQAVLEVGIAIVSVG